MRLSVQSQCHPLYSLCSWCTMLRGCTSSLMRALAVPTKWEQFSTSLFSILPRGGDTLSEYELETYDRQPDGFRRTFFRHCSPMSQHLSPSHELPSSTLTYLPKAQNHRLSMSFLFSSGTSSNHLSGLHSPAFSYTSSLA